MFDDYIFPYFTVKQTVKSHEIKYNDKIANRPSHIQFDT